MSKGPFKRNITESMLDDAYEVWCEEITREFQRIRKIEYCDNVDEIIKSFIKERGIEELNKAVRERRMRRGR